MIKFSDHVKTRLEEREISKNQVTETLENPDLILPARGGRKMAIKKVNEQFLKVIFIEVTRDIIAIIAHWMSKVKGLSKA